MKVALMRTNIDIDDQLMRQAMRSSGARTKKATVEAGLRLLVETHAQRTITRLRGKVQWQGDLNQSRLGRVRTPGLTMVLSTPRCGLTICAARKIQKHSGWSGSSDGSGWG